MADLAQDVEGAPKLAPFNPSSGSVIEQACELARLRQNDVVFDLGCGDGRLLVHMAREFGCECVGVEYDLKFVERARLLVQEAGVGHLVQVRHGDICKVADLDRATVLFMYLSVRGNEQLMALVQAAFDRGARILSNMFSLGYLGPPAATATCDNITKLYLYHKAPPPAGASGEPPACALASSGPEAPADLKEEPSEREEDDQEDDQEEDFIKRLERFLDPMRNPLISQVFNGAMIALATLLVILILTGNGNIHIYNIGGLSLVLTLLVNWYLGEMRAAFQAEAARQQAEREDMAQHDKYAPGKPPGVKKSD